MDVTMDEAAMTRAFESSNPNPNPLLPRGRGRRCAV